MNNVRRRLLKGVAVGGALFLAPMVNRNASRVFAGDETRYSTRAIDLVQRSLVVDMLGVLTMADADFDRWFYSSDGMTSAEIAAFKESGIKIFHSAIGLGGRTVHEDALTYTSAFNGFVARYSDHFRRIATVADLDAIATSGKVGVLIGVQNSDHFRTPEDVKTFWNLGQRVSQLTYNAQNLIGCGATERSDCGITDFGASIIARMNECGMVVDVSHCGEKTTLDAFEISKKPVAITHSNCRALVDHPRLKTDQALKKMAKAGGVMGITGVRMFVRDREPTTIEHVVDHIDHVRKLVGIEHVGIGTDSDLYGYDVKPAEWLSRLKGSYKASYGFRDKIDIEGFNHPRKIYDLTEALIRRKYTDEHIALVLGGNFRRLLAANWG
jgi:membrane dipeptidase